MSSKDLVGSLNALLNPRQRKTLKTVEPRGALRGKRANAIYTPKATGGGMASPLTETDYAQREFHSSLYLQSADGIFVWEFGPPKKLVLTDFNGDTHPINLASPES